MLRIEKSHERFTALACAFPLLIGSAFAAHAAQDTLRYEIEAEHYAQASGTSFSRYHQSITEVGAGDTVRYAEVPFMDGEFTTVTMIAKRGSSSGAVAMHLDSATGPRIAELTIDEYPRMRYAADLTDGITGVHDIVLTFSGLQDAEIDRFALVGPRMAPSGGARELHVDARRGSDQGGDGSAGKPFRTIARAAALLKAGDRCILHQGIYRETIRPVRSGRAGAPITFEAAPGEDVFVSAAEPVTGWQRHEGSIYAAPMPWSMGRKDRDQVFVDGEVMYWARTPNVEGPCPRDEKYESSTATRSRCLLDRQDRLHPLLIPALQKFSNCGEPVGNLSDATEFAACFDAYENVDEGMRGKPADFFKGALLLAYNTRYWSTMGWVLNSEPTTTTSGRMTVSRWSGANMGSPKNKAGFIAGVYGLLDSPKEWYRDSDEKKLYLMMPDGDDPASHLVEAKKRLLVANLEGLGHIHLKGLRFLGGSMTMRNSVSCRIEDCHFRYVSHLYALESNAEIAASGYGSSYDPSGGYKGIYLSGHDNVFTKSSVAVSAGSGIILDGRDNEISHSIIRDCNYIGSYDACIYVINKRFKDKLDPYHGTGHRILHNTISGASRELIHLSTTGEDVEQNPLRIQYNDFSYQMLHSFEGGAIYVYGNAGGGSDVSYNWFHSYGPTKCGNVVFDVGHRTPWKIHHNVSWNGDRLYERAIRCSFCADSTVDTMYNNTIVDSTEEGQGWPRKGFGHQFAEGGDNILYVASDTAVWKFFDPERRQYWLREGSPAIDAGTVLPGLVESYEGAAPDLGAYEYGEEPWTAGAGWHEQPRQYPPQEANVAHHGDVAGVYRKAPHMSVHKNRLMVWAPRGTPYRVVIYDPAGRRVYARNHPRGGSLQYSFSRLGRGVYVISMTHRCGRNTRSFMVAQ